MKFVFALLLALVAACSKPGIKQSSTNGINVELITEFDGCQIYRFFDSGHAIYVSKCSIDSNTTAVPWIGKNQYPVQVQTIWD